LAEPATTPFTDPRRSNAVAWLAVAVALSPVLVDTALHALREPWARPALLFALVLSYRAWKSDGEAPRAPWLGFSLAFVAAVAGAALAAAAWPRFGRLAIPLCVLGLSMRSGRPTFAIAGIALWCLPPPSVFLELASPGLETAWTTLARLLSPEGARFPFAVGAQDGGFALAWWLAGAGYVRALDLGRGGWRGLPLCLAGALAAFPIQLAALWVALNLSPGGAGPEIDAQTATWLLREVFPLCVVAFAVLLAPWRPHVHLRR
jgi:hypothetical protein